MSNKNLFKEAIADAKAVREAALANAKAALEEALTPKLQSMLAAKLQEMDLNEDEEIDEAKESKEKMKAGMYPTDTSDKIQDRYRATGAALEEADEELEEDFDLSEILAELNEAEEKEEAGEEAEGESEEEEATEEEPTEEEGEEDVEVKDMTVEDLKDLIRDIVSQEIESETPADMGGEEGEETIDMGSEETPAGGDEDEIDLEELLAELDSLEEYSETQPDRDMDGDGDIDADDVKMMKEAKKKKAKEDKEKKEEMKEGLFSGIKKALGLDCISTYNKEKASLGEDKAYDNFVKCMESRGGVSASGTEKGASAAGGDWKKFGQTTGEFKEEMAEAIETINTLRNELNEVNLLNAKLLYVNKLFKAKNLTESQKVKVIASFDKATNVKEAKVVFESLQSALTTAPKNQIKENLGFASKAAGVAPNKTIVESNDVIARMQKLANIR